MTILHWIRAVAKAPLSPGCKAFCLEIIPHMNSSSLSSNFSTGRMATKVSATSSSVKTYRSQLQKAKLLSQGRGWKLTLPDWERPPDMVDTHQPENMNRLTHINQNGGPTSTTLVDTHQPRLYNSTSTISSTNVPTNNNPPEVDERLKRIRQAHRPNVGNRVYDSSLNISYWFRQWKEAKGSGFPWGNWAGAVLPYLTEAERGELLDTLLNISNPNLRYASAIVTRMCSGVTKSTSTRDSGKPGSVPLVIAGRSEDDDLWLEKISG